MLHVGALPLPLLPLRLSIILMYGLGLVLGLEHLSPIPNLVLSSSNT
jgi:hypothetical protein